MLPPHSENQRAGMLVNSVELGGTRMLVAYESGCESFPSEPLLHLLPLLLRVGLRAGLHCLLVLDEHLLRPLADLFLPRALVQGFVVLEQPLGLLLRRDLVLERERRRRGPERVSVGHAALGPRRGCGLHARLLLGRGARAAFHPLGPQVREVRVVGLAQLLVVERHVRLPQLVESLHVAALVRVQLQGALAVRVLHVVGRRGLLNPQRHVVVALRDRGPQLGRGRLQPWVPQRALIRAYAVRHAAFLSQ